MTGPDLEIRVVPRGGLGRLLPGAASDPTVVVRRGTTLRAALTRHGIDCGLVGVASADSRLIRLEAPLENDCVVDIYPFFGGG